MKEFYVKKDGNKIILTIREIKETKVELDIEDIQQLNSDLYLFLTNQSAPSGLQFHNKEHYEAYLQNQSKNKLSEQIQRDIEERFGNRFKVNPDGTVTPKSKDEWIPSEIELTTLKTKKNGK
jgi:hypothetical protein